MPDKFNLYVENVSQDGLPIVRVGCTKEASTLQLSSSGNFKLINLPILQVIQWLGSIQEIKDDLNWYLDRGSNPVNLQKLTPAKGLFIDKADMTVDQDLKYELFRFEDGHSIKAISTKNSVVGSSWPRCCQGRWQPTFG